MSTKEEQTNKIGQNTGNRGKGRPKGAVNKNSKLLKDAILEAAERAGNKFGKEGWSDNFDYTRQIKAVGFTSVSYTHLTLPTNREV